MQKYEVILLDALVTPLFLGMSHCNGLEGIPERGGGLGSRPIFKKFHETYAPS